MAWRRTWAVCLALGLQCLLSFGAAAYVFTVGGRRGWAVPTGNKTETFNQWAERNRFQVGDTLVFKYKQGQDSVLRVSAEDYQACNTAKPIESYSDGHTMIKIPRSGPFYFISGAAGNCQNGEKLIVVVLFPRNYSRSGGRAVPAAAPAPSIASPPGIAPSPLVAAPAPVVASPPSKAPSPSTLSPAPGPSPLSASAPFRAPTPFLVPSPGPSTASPAPASSIVSPTPASVTSPAPVPAPSSASPTPSSLKAPAPAPSTASPTPSSLKAPAPVSSNAPSIPPSTGTPPPSASSPVVAAPSAPPSAESTKPSAAAPIGFASALSLFVIIVSSLLN